MWKDEAILIVWWTGTYGSLANLVRKHTILHVHRFANDYNTKTKLKWYIQSLPNNKQDGFGFYIFIFVFLEEIENNWAIWARITFIIENFEIQT
jgi:hypothetical protein